MISIYAVLQTLLPFEWAGHHFMLNAFLAILLVTPLFGLLSTMVVSNRMAFFSDSLGHGAFTGIAIGVLLGSVSPLLSLVLFSVAFAIFITYIQNKSTASTDTIIGVFSSTAIALGLMMMSYGGGFNKFSSYLIGDILSVTPDDIGALAIIFLLVLAAWGVLFNRLLVLSINASFARGAPRDHRLHQHPVGRHPDHQRPARPASRRRAQCRAERQAVSRRLHPRRPRLRHHGPPARLLLQHGRRRHHRRRLGRRILRDAGAETVFCAVRFLDWVS